MVCPITLGDHNKINKSYTLYKAVQRLFFFCQNVYPEPPIKVKLHKNEITFHSVRSVAFHNSQSIQSFKCICCNSSSLEGIAANALE